MQAQGFCPIIERHYPKFREVMAAQDKPLPLHVQQEFAEYLKCGRLVHGFLRVQCSKCHHARNNLNVHFHSAHPCAPPFGRPAVVQIGYPAWWGIA
jgi:hypothetical protein